MKLTMMLAAWGPLIGTLLWSSFRRSAPDDWPSYGPSRLQTPLPAWLQVALFTWAVIGTAIYTHL